jgi:hypothetical protein
MVSEMPGLLGSLSAQGWFASTTPAQRGRMRRKNAERVSLAEDRHAYSCPAR